MERGRLAAGPGPSEPRWPGASRGFGRLIRGMDGRRVEGAPALWRRVRWANVGRLAVLLAAAFLIGSGGRGCRSGSPPPLRAPVGPMRAERPPWPKGALSERRLPKPWRDTASAHSHDGKSEGQRRRRTRRRPGRDRAGGRREASAPEQRLALPAAPVEPVEPVVTRPAPTPPPTPGGPATPAPSAGPGEFSPDPGG
jgi:hypothetical protein